MNHDWTLDETAFVVDVFVVLRLVTKAKIALKSILQYKKTHTHTIRFGDDDGADYLTGWFASQS